MNAAAADFDACERGDVNACERACFNGDFDACDRACGHKTTTDEDDCDKDPKKRKNCPDVCEMATCLGGTDQACQNLCDKSDELARKVMSVDSGLCKKSDKHVRVENNK